MKTSVIEVSGLLSVFGVEAVEAQIAEVPGVESVTVNFAAGNATVRYDETRVDVADIKAAIRHAGSRSDESPHEHADHPQAASGEPVKTSQQSSRASDATPDRAVPSVAAAAPTSHVVDNHKGHASTTAQPATSAASPAFSTWYTRPFQPTA